MLNKRLKVWLAGGALALAAGAAFLLTGQQAEAVGCREDGNCTSQTQGCEPIPTSLPKPNGPRVDVGWTPNGSECGTYSCYVFLRCACGNKLGLDLCEEQWPPPCV